MIIVLLCKLLNNYCNLIYKITYYMINWKRYIMDNITIIIFYKAKKFEFWINLCTCYQNQVKYQLNILAK